MGVRSFADLYQFKCVCFYLQSQTHTQFKINGIHCDKTKLAVYMQRFLDYDWVYTLSLTHVLMPLHSHSLIHSLTHYPHPERTEYLPWIYTWTFLRSHSTIYMSLLRTGTSSYEVWNHLQLGNFLNLHYLLHLFYFSFVIFFITKFIIFSRMTLNSHLASNMKSVGSSWLIINRNCSNFWSGNIKVYCGCDIASTNYGNWSEISV